MRISDVLKGALVASAAAGLFACAAKQGQSTMSPGETGEMVKCAGINECGGKGQCGAADGSHDCAGKNTCRGKGWIKVSKDECSSKGGQAM